MTGPMIACKGAAGYAPMHKMTFVWAGRPRPYENIRLFRLYGRGLLAPCVCGVWAHDRAPSSFEFFSETLTWSL
jgi:hypothetical protein